MDELKDLVYQNQEKILLVDKKHQKYLIECVIYIWKKYLFKRPKTVSKNTSLYIMPEEIFRFRY